MNKSIIVADDSMIVKNIIENALQDEYTVLKAKDGKELINYNLIKGQQIYMQN